MYLDYSAQSYNKKGGLNMNIFCISDLHLDLTNSKPMDIFGSSWENYLEEIEKSWEENVKDEDIVLISGDISWAMTLKEFEKDLDYLKKFKGKIVLNRGNHDYWWSSITQIRNILPKNIYALQNDFIRFENVLICATRGWELPERNEEINETMQKMIDRELIRMELSLSQMQAQRKETDTVIYMLHYPPFNSTRQQNAFLDLLEKYNVDIVVYGHLHGKNIRATKQEERNGIRFYLTSCDQVENQLVKIL